MKLRAIIQKSQFHNSPVNWEKFESATQANIQKSKFYNFPVLFSLAIGQLDNYMRVCKYKIRAYPQSQPKLNQSKYW